MSDPIAKLRSLHEAATPGPWKIHTDGVVTCPDGLSPVSTKRGQGSRETNRQVPVLLFNAMPALLDYAEALESSSCTCVIHNNECCPYCRKVNQARAALEAALEE